MQHCETAILISLFEGSRRLKIARDIKSPSKQDKRAMIQFISKERCMPVRRMVTLYGANCLSEITVTDWLQTFRRGPGITTDLARPHSEKIR